VIIASVSFVKGIINSEIETGEKKETYLPSRSSSEGPNVSLIAVVAIAAASDDCVDGATETFEAEVMVSVNQLSSQPILFF
jgi:hypothetical protein